MNKLFVRLQDVHVYQQKQQVLKEVNLSIHKGEFTYLIGKTGSGKSSLLKIIYGALPLHKGKGEVAGFNLKSLDRRTLPLLRRQLGIVFQDFNLLNDRSVAENLRFVMKATAWKDEEKIKQRMQEVLRQVALQGMETKMPHELSGGEKQRVVIARALLNQPGLIIADEPTGNLDPETSDDILLLMRKLAEENDTAVLFATHDYRILENFPARIMRCVNGRLIVEEDFEL